MSGIEPVTERVVLVELMGTNRFIKQNCLISEVFLPCSEIFRNFSSLFSENIAFCGPFCTSFILEHFGTLGFLRPRKTRNLLHKYQYSVQIMHMKFFRFDILAT